MDLDSLKIVVILVVFFLPLMATLIPLRIIKYVQSADASRRNSLHRLLSLLNCFSGGVFLGACLLDLLPDVEDMFDDITSNMSGAMSFPLAQFTVVVGFFLVLLVEGLVAASHGESVDEQDSLITSVSPTSSSGYEAVGDGYQHSPTEDVSDPTMSPTGHGHGHAHSHADSQASLRSVMLVVALSLHSVVEGLAIGLQESRDLLLQIFLAVVIHKGILGFSLGLSLVRDGALGMGAMVLSALSFCCASPLGVAIGWAISDAGHGTAVQLTNAILQGIACGTFLYITFFEVLPHEFRDNRDRLLRILFMVLGFATVCAVLFLDPDVRTPRCVIP